MLHHAARLLIVAAWMAVITYWSGQSSLPIDAPPVGDALHGFQHRIAHLLVFALLGVLARRAFDGLPRAALLAVLVTSVFGATDEWHQSFTPGRRAAVDDWALDTLAAGVAVFAWVRVRETRLQPSLRAFAPLAVSVAFLVGIGLAARPAMPGGLASSAVRAVAVGAVDLARETRNLTRDLARQFRATIS